MVAAVAAAAITVALAMLPHADLGFHNLTTRVAIDTAAGIGAFVAAWLAFARYRRAPSLPMLLLAGGLGTYAFTAFFAFLFPEAFGLSNPEIAGAPVLGRLVAGLLLAGAAFARTAPMARRPSARATAGFIVAVSALCTAIGIVLADRWPSTFVGDLGGQATGIEHASGLYVALTAGSVALYMLCGATLGLRAVSLHDTMVAWLALGVSLLAVGRLESLLLASASPSLVAVGDVFRVTATAAFLAAAAAEFHSYERRLSEAIVADERRRLARELHDGLAQDLAFVVSQAGALSRKGPNQEIMGDIARAGERAMSDARRAIHLLNRPRSRALSAVIAQRAYEVASRSGLELNFAMLGGEVEAMPEVEHAIVQIVTEAVSNAAKHSGASTVSIELSSTGGRYWVRVTDDGVGFDPSAVRRRRRFSGFGLVSMAERADAFGGELRLESEPGVGTTVEVGFK